MSGGAGDDPAIDYGMLLRRESRRDLDLASEILGWKGNRLHRGVHQGRKALRRVRAALALGAPVLGRGGRLADAELRRILHALSELRDGQALVEVLERGAARLPSEHAPLLARALRVAQARRAELGRDAGGVAATRDQLEAIGMWRAAIGAMPWTRVDHDTVRQALAFSSEQLAGAATRVEKDADDDEAWHRWRRRARRLTQQHRLLADTPLAIDRKDEKDFAERLGVAQDLSLLVAHCGRDSPFTRDDRRELARIAGVEMARHRRHLLARGEHG
jgi:CHAD domain-containing protein